MASNINANNIDGTYPVAGVDNDSQGFRTNFTNIKNNLAYAKSELEDLQSKVVLKSALSGTSLVNNMAGSLFYAAEVKDLRETINDLGSVSGTITLDHSAGHYHTVTPTGSITLAFSNFPASGKGGRVRLKIVLASTSYTVTFPASVNRGIDSLEGFNPSTSVLTFAATGTYYLEFVSDDQGTNYHVQDLSRPRKATANTAVYADSSTGNFKRFTYANLSNNFSTTATNTLIIDSTGPLNIGNVYLPSSTTATAGQVVKVTSNNAISTLNLISNGLTIIGNVTTLAANSRVEFQYVSTASKWFRIG